MKKLLFVLVLFAVILPVKVSAADIVAQAAILVDFETGEILFERDAYSLRHPASMTKIMTAFVLYEEVAAGRMSFDTMITISPNAAQLSRMFGARHRLNVGASYSAATLLYLSMLPSSNAASLAIAEHISGTEEAFVRLMNDHARQLGLHPDFSNSWGEDHGGHNFTNAYSMAMLVREFIIRHPTILQVTGADTMEIDRFSMDNTNRLLHGSRYFEGADGFKTGFTRAARSTLAATAMRDGRRVITVVMNAPSGNAAADDAATLLNLGLNWVNITIEGVPFSNLSSVVQNGQFLVPVREIFERLGFNIGWDGEARQVIMSRADTTVVLTLDNFLFRIDDSYFWLDVPPQLIGNSTMIPIQAVLERLDYSVEWDAFSRTLDIGTRED
ncbi:MAG: stalk domain-containing protein [Turicibacter sp.]|nr:stalk domain-containing protein [Turicibacter sp.]